MHLCAPFWQEARTKFLVEVLLDWGPARLRTYIPVPYPWGLSQEVGTGLGRRNQEIKKCLFAIYNHNLLCYTLLLFLYFLLPFFFIKICFFRKNYIFGLPICLQFRLWSPFKIIDEFCPPILSNHTILVFKSRTLTITMECWLSRVMFWLTNDNNNAFHLSWIRHLIKTWHVTIII